MELVETEINSFLVEEEEAESEIEVIQDLSYHISSKLKSIIRNFG